MAKRDMSKRAERIAKNNRRLNAALVIFTIGFAVEFYLLQINNFYVKGTLDQLIATATYLEVMVYVGLAVLAAGIACFALREKKPCLGKAAAALMVLGVFLTLSSQLMRKVYPAGTTALCVAVPVVTLMCVVFLLYPAEFSVQATALVLATGCAALISRDPAGTLLSVVMYAVCILSLVIIAVGFVAVKKLQGSDGTFGAEENKIAVFSAKTSYAAIYAVLAVSAVAILAALFVPGVAYYLVWAGAVALFLLAVLHTVKML